MNLKNIKNIDLFNPYILIAIVILFILIALPSFYITGELKPVYPQLYGYVALGLIFFILGAQFPKLIAKYSNVFKKLYNETKNKKITNITKGKKLPNFGNYSKTEKVLIAIVLVGILLQIINLINLGGIPLFSASLKSKAATKLWLISYIIFLPGINILLGKYNRKTYYLLLIIGLGLFALTGYRTTPISILLSVFITLYYTREFKLKYQIIFIVAILFLLIAIGFIAMKAISWQHWRLNPLELISYRAGFTLKILDRAINRQFVTGGSLFISTLTGFFNSIDPRVLIGQAVLSKAHSTTATIFGPALLDFGAIGMTIQMFIIGFILKTLHLIQKYKLGIATGLYGILLAQTLIWIETGPTDLVVWIFYLIGVIIIIYNYYKIKSSN